MENIAANNTVVTR